MRRWKSYQIVFLVIICLLINFAGKTLAELWKLPLWMDSVGTVLAAYVFGPFCGVVVGVGVNIMYGAFSSASYLYAITNAMVGVITGYGARKGMFKKPFLAFSLSMILALVATVISMPLNIVFNNGMTGNLWGDGVINYLSELGAIKGICWFFGEFYVDLLDKLISVLIVYVILVLDKKKIKSKNITATILAFIIFFGMPFNAIQIQASDTGVNPGYYDSYIQTVYNNTNGISGGEVNAIAQTRDGMLWIGTYGGLYQYDGTNFTFMNTFDSVRNVNCLYTDEEGRLWIGTNDNGLSISANNEIVNIVDKTSGLPEDSVRSITKGADGLYYVGTSGSMCIIALTDGVKVTDRFEELSYVKNLTSSANGYVCAVNLNGELAIIENAKIKNIIKSDAEGNKFHEVYFDEENILYASTSGNYIRKYEIINGQLKEVAKYNCGDLVNINAMYKMEKNFLFVCADNGIGYIDLEGTFNKINTNNFDSSIDHMLVDYQGNLWFSSSRLGLLELSESISEEIYARVGIDANVVNAIYKWNNEFYFGTDAGLDIVDANITTIISNDLTKLLKGVRIRCIEADSNNHLWIATSGHGVYEITTDEKWVQYSTENGLIGDKARAILELADGRIAVSTDTGISFIKNGKIVSAISAEDGLINPKTLCMYEKSGVLYAGSDGGGLGVIINGKVEKVLRKADGLSSDVILRMVEADKDGGLYIITSNGLNFMDNEGEIRQLNNFPFYNNFDIIRAKDNSLWITSSAGVFVVDEESLLYKKELDYELIDSKKGMRDNLIANSWNYLDNENLYLCADNGVVLININKYDKQRASYRIMLESVLVDDTMIGVDKEEINVLSRDVVRVEFFPKVINYSASNPYVSVWLEGFDIEPKVVLQSELESMVYTNLPSGNYKFHLAILDNKQENIVEKITYSFVKEKEIYDNWWFILYILLIMIIILVYLVWLIIGSQIDKSLKIQKKEFENLKLKQQADAAYAASEAKDKFLALMSHDIRTPINAILGMNEMIMRESKEKEIFEYSNDIKSAGNTLLALVNMILDYSKIEEGKMEIIPVKYETRNLITNLVNGVLSRAKAKGIEFKLDIDGNIPKELFGDDVRINQVISNLLTNAVKYTEKGYFSLTIRQESRHEDVVALYVEVRDTGIGIKDEDIEKLFESFKRLDEERNRKIEGTGLGMSIVSSLLQLMGSHLDVESIYGQGSVFSFVIEQKIVSDDILGDFTTDNKDEYEKKNVEHIYAPNAKVLIVDDNEMNIKVAAGLLKANGITPDKVTSGLQAIDLVKNKQYDIVFLDHMMPEMDGIETFDLMKKQNLIDENTKVIVLTANAINGAKEQYIKAGFDDYLSKPIDVNALEEKLLKYLKPDLIFEKKTEEQEHEEQKADLTSMQPKDRLATICSELDISIGLKYCMESMDFYDEVLIEYVKGDKTEELCKFYTAKDWHNYRVLIHSVKSNSMSIGAVTTSEHAKALEYASRDEDIAYIETEHDNFIKEYNELLEHLKKYLGK